MDTTITYALDQPTSRDYLYEELFTDNESDEKEEWKWIHSKRPDDVTVWNQGNTPACTCYSACHLYNGYNLLEDDILGITREQQDPSILRNSFCAERNNWNSGTAIQTMANWFKSKWYIRGYVTIPVHSATKVAQMKWALDRGFFLSTGSAYGDWGNIKRTGIYSERADRMYVWHARCIVDYNNEWFIAVNSYWPTRGKFGNGTFIVPFDMVDKIYSCLVFIDKDDSWNFSTLADSKKVEEMITIAKELYNKWNTEIKSYFEQIQLSKTMKRLYNI